DVVAHGFEADRGEPPFTPADDDLIPVRPPPDILASELFPAVRTARAGTFSGLRHGGRCGARDDERRQKREWFCQFHEFLPYPRLRADSLIKERQHPHLSCRFHGVARTSCLTARGGVLRRAASTKMAPAMRRRPSDAMWC